MSSLCALLCQPGLHSHHLLWSWESELRATSLHMAQNQRPRLVWQQHTGGGCNPAERFPENTGRTNFEFDEFSSESELKHSIHLQMSVLPAICCIL